MKRLMPLLFVLIGSLAWPTLGQDGSEPAPSPAQETKAIAVFHAPGEFKADDARAATARLREAVGALTDFRSLDDAQSLSDLVRLLLTASSIGPGVTVAVLDVVADADDPQRTAGLRVIARLHGERTDDLSPQVGGFSAGDSVVFVSYADAVTTIWFDTTGNTKEHDIADSLAAFADHRKGVESGLELMLDLESLRRAWPHSLEDGPARRVVAVTGLANARKVHVHIPARGTVRLAYSSRALPPDRVSVKQGPAPQNGADVGVRWPIAFDAGLRLYAVSLGDEARQSFATTFQAWMGEHGNRLRGMIQAAEVGLGWSVQRGEGGALRTEATVPVRNGVSTQALADATMATLRGSGFTIDGTRAQLALPGSVAKALGGTTLTIEIDDSAQPVVYRLVIE